MKTSEMSEEEARKLAEKMAKKDAGILGFLVNLVVFLMFLTVAIVVSNGGASFWGITLVGILFAVICQFIAREIIYNKYYPLYIQKLRSEKNEM